MKGLIIESPRELLKVLKSKPQDHALREKETTQENAPRNLYTPTRSVSVNISQDNDTNASRNTTTGVLTDSTNQVKKAKAVNRRQRNVPQ